MRRALQENEDWNQDLVEHSRDLLCIHDLEGRLLSVNPAPARVLGYSVEEMLRIPMREMVAPEFRDQFEAYLKQIASAGEANGLTAVMTRSGERRIWEYHNTLRTEGVESPIVRGIAHDVTEQKRAEKLARDASERLLDKVSEGERTIRELKLFRALVEQSNDSIEIVDLETLRFLDVNEKACSALGYTREELLSLRVFDIDPNVTESSVVAIREQWRNLGWLVLESVHRRKDGSTFPVEVSTKQVHVDRDYVIAIARDLTERKQAEARLLEYERVVEGLDEMIVVMDREYRFVIANRALLKKRKLEREQLIGRSLFEQMSSEGSDEGTIALVKQKMDECFQGKAVHYELRYRYPEVGERDLLLSYFPIDGPNGIDRIACILRDITERKQAQQALRRSEDDYRNFVSQSSEGIFRDDLIPPVPIDLPEDEFVHRFLHDTVMVECNAAMAAMYGFVSGEELRGLPMSERVVPEDPRNIEMAREFIRSGFRLLERESHEVDRYGNPRIFLNSMIGTVENGMLVRIWGIQRDITEKVRLEESRRKAEEDLRQNVAQLQAVTEELRVAKEKLSEEKLYLEQTIDTELGFGEIIGRSNALREVMEKVAKVAPSDATVLLLGETGTGKELVARALHRRSHREGNSFIKLNCAAIPSGLLESELFGHEKGAFTGAVARKLGRLELADKGTLFLDEVGEIPLSLQPKLLRVLQDLEFERLGGTQTLKVNFRLLAATNRDLLQAVKAREFRSDLYYRLNVFPIVIPPLRERREDIRPLIEHFVLKFAAQMKKSITSIPSKTMEMLVRWDWPGNIRELENFVERSVILTPGSVLQAPLSELQAAVGQGSGESRVTVRDHERERILRALRECHGRLGGPDGAAARLGLKRTTLQSKLDQLGIKPGEYRA
jgi:formate hydrogenlyase transcriptional activator